MAPRRSSSALKRLPTLYFTVISVVLGETFQPMRWCGPPLNPREAAKAARTATFYFMECRKHTMALNVKTSMIKELEIFCVAARVCFRAYEDVKNITKPLADTLLDCAEKVATAWVTLHPRCAKDTDIRDLPYILKTFEYFKDFASG
ncbi:uncharacterized protein LOC144145165 isoform X2 [Haemaphysalis longicornis]